ncbi:MAG: ubiquinol-cytochrome c reductase iron-sulfur subunit [Thermoanaerobaculia bacterium]
MDQDHKTGRRTFVNWFLGTSLGALCLAVVYPVARFISPPDVPEGTTNQVDAGLTTDPELLEKKFKIVRFGADPVLLLWAGEDDYRAFAATCTHLDCVVEYQDAERRIWCNCHNGEYDLQGRNVAGPPPRPLEVYKVHVDRQSPGMPGTIIVERS